MHCLIILQAPNPEAEGASQDIILYRKQLANIAEDFHCNPCQHSECRRKWEANQRVRSRSRNRYGKRNDNRNKKLDVSAFLHISLLNVFISFMCFNFLFPNCKNADILTL